MVIHSCVVMVKEGKLFVSERFETSKEVTDVLSWFEDEEWKSKKCVLQGKTQVNEK